MECDCGDNRNFHRGWRRFFSELIYRITGCELLDAMTSNRGRGVYIIILVDLQSEEIFIKYIGSSVNMRDRLYKGKHPAYDPLQEDAKNSTYKECIVMFIDTPRYLQIEKLLIKSLRPELNIQHNGK